MFRADHNKIPLILCSTCKGIIKCSYYTEHETQLFHYRHICHAKLTTEQLDALQPHPEYPIGETNEKSS